MKRTIKQVLHDRLVETGILPEPAAMEEEEEDVSPDVGLGAVSDRALPNVEHVDPALAIKMKELDLQIKQEERETLLIKLRLIEAETDQAFRLQQLKEQDLKNRPVPRARSQPPSVTSPAAAAAPQSSHEAGADANFDVSKNLKLVPPFRESEADAYFVTFERIATKLSWPKDVWALFLQCSLTGKAQEVSSAFPLEQSLDYDAVKAAVLRAYELVPKAYRQKFRSHAKTAKQTCIEFARETRPLFEKWCFSNRVTTLEHLQELVLLEEFKNCVPESVVVHLNDQKVTSLVDAAVLADKFTLTHKSVFTTVRRNLVPLTSESSAREKAYDSSRAKTETLANSLHRKSNGK